MAAPKGNQFWKLRSKHGKDKIFKTPEIMWKAACEYFEYIDKNPLVIQDNKGTKNVNEVELKRPYTIHGLCIFLDVNIDYFTDFADNLKGKTDKISKDYSRIIKHIRTIIYNQKFEGAAIGIFQHNIIARDLGLIEKRQSEVNLNGTKFQVKLINDRS